MKTDIKSVAGKHLEIAGETQVLVIGAGPAGIAAARKAREGGAEVVLVDENPVPFDAMGESVPQIWGDRMSALVRNRNAMTEAMLDARAELAEMFEIGVDVRLGTACWGLFANQPNMGWMSGLVAGLIDAAEGNRYLKCQQVIVATGQRDMGLAFPGWDAPGVMGAGAAVMLARLYGALESRVAVMIGSTDAALLQALDLVEAGVRIATIVEQADRPMGSDRLVARVREAGISFRLSEAPRGVISGTDGVEGLVLREGTVACDTVLLGVGAVPMVDLMQAAGAQMRFCEDRSGFVPVLDEGMETTLPGLRAAGDCTGIWTTKSAECDIAAAEGRIAAGAALVALGLESGEISESLPQPAPAIVDPGEYRKAWVRVAVVEALEEMPVCQCEEVTAREILEVRPPRYLNIPPKENETRTLREILAEGAPDPDQIKRLTRAGMGPCQGRRCREQVQALLALQEDLSLGAIPLAGYRAPVRPLTLADAAIAEDPQMTANWEPWFGIPPQWAPLWTIGEKYTVASLSTEEEFASE
ncbi:NAD(P)/FAD-dependent oxidoreductase [Amorphus sp. 3PC139-8]|uniref:FAD/NAD(P)-dependent oxidoreductase n=1 Tax=Amorphus sp. 3PC139-8 TaxID=2735676 RepID=UPI00345DA37B